MADPSSLSTLASIIAAFGVAMLFFRIQRELRMRAKRQPVWLPWADRLLIGATLVSLFFVLVPMLLLKDSKSAWALLPPSAAATACVLVAGYIPAILAHYRIIFAGDNSGARPPLEIPEAVLVTLTAFQSAAFQSAAFQSANHCAPGSLEKEDGRCRRTSTET